MLARITEMQHHPSFLESTFSQMSSSLVCLTQSQNKHWKLCVCVCKVTNTKHPILGKSNKLVLIGWKKYQINLTTEKHGRGQASTCDPLLTQIQSILPELSCCFGLSDYKHPSYRHTLPLLLHSLSIPCVETDSGL